jgi:hypothetical protein
MQEMCDEVPAAKQLFDRASDILGYDLLQVCIEGVLHPEQPSLFVPLQGQWALSAEQHDG